MPLTPTGELRGGRLVLNDSPPFGFEKTDFLYDHHKRFRGPSFEPMRGDGGQVDVTVTRPGRPPSGSAAITIRVEPFEDVCAYVDQVWRRGPLYEAILPMAGKDARLTWYQENAILEDWLRLKDYAELAHDFYPNGTPDPARCFRMPCSATPAFYCHDYAWRPSNPTAPVTAGHLDNAAILGFAAANGYQELKKEDPWAVGDVVCFAVEQAHYDAPDHSAVVSGTRNGIELPSKDTDNSLFVHRLTMDPSTDWFYKRYGTYGLRRFRLKPRTP